MGNQNYGTADVLNIMRKVDTLVENNKSIIENTEIFGTEPRIYLVGDTHSEDKHKDFVIQIIKDIKPDFFFSESHSSVCPPNISSKFFPTMEEDLHKMGLDAIIETAKFLLPDLLARSGIEKDERYKHFVNNPSLVLKTPLHRIPRVIFEMYELALMLIFSHADYEIKSRLSFYLPSIKTKKSLIENIESEIGKSVKTYFYQAEEMYVCSQVGATIVPFDYPTAKKEIIEGLGIISEKEFNSLNKLRELKMCEILEFILREHPDTISITNGGAFHIRKDSPIVETLKRNNIPHYVIRLGGVIEDKDEKLKQYRDILQEK